MGKGTPPGTPRLLAEDPVKGSQVFPKGSNVTKEPVNFEMIFHDENLDHMENRARRKLDAILEQECCGEYFCAIIRGSERKFSSSLKRVIEDARDWGLSETKFTLKISFRKHD